tara:strand:- start:384 stop:581 length:198 start_codon:yes stop_codon:yes gene_type:complete
MRGRRRRGSQDDKREAAFRMKPSLIILKVRSSSEERSNFTIRPVVLSVVFALKDRRLSFRRRRRT